MSGGGGVKDDVVVRRGDVRIGQQCREFVERGDLRRTCTRQLFFDALDHVLGEHATDRPDDAIAVDLRRGLGVDLQRGQPLDFGDGRDLVADAQPEHLSDVGGGVGADEQHASPRIRQVDSGRTGDGRLAHAALAREEDVAREAVEKLQRHGPLSSSPNSSSNWWSPSAAAW